MLSRTERVLQKLFHIKRLSNKSLVHGSPSKDFLAVVNMRRKGWLIKKRSYLKMVQPVSASNLMSLSSWSLLASLDSCTGPRSLRSRGAWCRSNALIWSPRTAMTRTPVTVLRPSTICQAKWTSSEFSQWERSTDCFRNSEAEIWVYLTRDY